MFRPRTIARLEQIEEVPTTDLHLETIIYSMPCVAHLARTGQPCYSWKAANADTDHHGICNARAIRYGMVGEIKPGSLDRKYRGGKAAGEAMAQTRQNRG